MKTTQELRALPEFQLFTTYNGVHPETNEPCELVKTNYGQLLVANLEDVELFTDTDGSPMRVVNTTDGLMKMKV